MKKSAEFNLTISEPVTNELLAFPEAPYESFTILNAPSSFRHKSDIEAYTSETEDEFHLLSNETSILPKWLDFLVYWSDKEPSYSGIPLPLNLLLLIHNSKGHYDHSFSAILLHLLHNAVSSRLQKKKKKVSNAIQKIFLEFSKKPEHPFCVHAASHLLIEMNQSQQRKWYSL